jgi:hypothetical protein
MNWKALYSWLIWKKCNHQWGGGNSHRIKDLVTQLHLNADTVYKCSKCNKAQFRNEMN